MKPIRIWIAGVALASLALPLWAGEDAGAPYVTRVYDVGFLTRTVKDHPHKPMGMIPPRFEIEPEAPAAAERGGLEVETVTAMLQGVTTDWKDPASIQNTETYVIVVHRETVHKRIETLLESIRKKRGTTVTCMLRAYAVSGPTGLGGEGIFTETEGKAFVKRLESEANVREVRAWTLTGFSGQRIAAWEGVERLYLREYDAEVAQESAVADPMVATVREGMSFTVRPTVARSGEVLLDLKASLATLLGSIEEKNFNAEKMGSMEKPVLHMQEVQTSVLVPAGGYAVMGTFASEPKPAPSKTGEGQAAETPKTRLADRYLLVAHVVVREAHAKGSGKRAD
jgi:hypothetical protein